MNGHKALIVSIVLISCSSCYISNIDLPATAQPNSSFETIIEATKDGNPVYVSGAVSIVVPDAWSVDSVSYDGPISGQMIPADSLAYYLSVTYPPPANYKWLSFCSESGGSTSPGDVFDISMTVHTDDLLGMIPLSFHIAWFIGGAVSWDWDEDPIADSIEVVELNLEQSTWGSVKAQLGNR